MARKILGLRASALALAASMAAPAALHAQTAPAQGEDVPASSTDAGPQAPSSDGGLAEIVVTAQRRAENLQRVPIAVTAITADTLSTKGIIDTRLLATAVPGLTFTTQANLAAPRIRGVGTAIAGAGNENPVSLYVDGVYYASAGASVMSFNNISQIAVLKGPQGTLFGRNATGGLIQITTRDPSSNFGGQADVSIGNKKTYGGNLYVTGGLAEGLAADLAVQYRDQADGFGRNLFNGKEVNKNRNFSVRSKIQAKPDDRTVATLMLDYSHSRSASPTYRLVDNERGLDGKFFTGGKFDTNVNVQPVTTVKQYGAALNLSRDLDFAKLVSITAYRRSDFRGTFDSDGQPEDYISVALLEPGRQFSQEIQLVSNGGGPFTWQAGAYYFWARDGYYPADIFLPLFGITSHIRTLQRTRSIAGYAQGTYRFTDRLSLTLGARLTHETKTMHGSGAIDVLGTPIVIPEGPYSDKITVTRPTWRVALDYQIDPSVMVYASYNRGFKSGGFEPGATQTAVPFKPETLDAFEVGVKSEFFDRKVRLNAAGFYYDYRNVQLNSFANGVTGIYNGKSATIYGLDLDITAAPVRNLTLTGGLSLLHDRFSDFPVTYTAVAPAGGLIQLPDGSAKGKRLQNTPDWQLNAGISYRVPLPAGDVTLTADYFHSGRWYSTPENRLFQKAYNLYNASATWSIGASGHYTLQVWGRNLSNTAYADQLVIQIPVADFVNMAQGRAFGATFGVKF